MKSTTQDDATLSRAERILAKILISSMTDKAQKEHIWALAECDVPNSDIATLLGTTTANVSQQIYLQHKSRKRKGGGKPKGKR